MKEYIMLLIISACSLSAWAQDPDIMFSGDFRDVPFTQFVRELESGTGSRIYYQNEWVYGIRVNASGKELSLSKTLSELFAGTNLFFMIARDMQVFVTQNTRLIRVLPEYTAGEEFTVKGNLQEDARYLQAEQRYIEGRSTGRAENVRAMMEAVKEYGVY